MTNSRTNNNAGTGRFGRVMAAEKKKIVIACSLLALMAMMWVRVLSGNGPATALAQTEADAMSEPKESDVKVTYIELPFIEGKHDVLARNYFNFKDEGRTDREADVISNETTDGINKRVLEKFTLDAIELGETPQAFINGKLLGLGGKLPVMDGDVLYEFEVVVIEENRVALKCDDFEVSLGFQAIGSEEQF